MDSGPLRLPPRGKDGGAEAGRPTCRGGSVGNPSRGPGPRLTLTAAVKKDGAWLMVQSSTVNEAELGARE